MASNADPGRSPVDPQTERIAGLTAQRDRLRRELADVKAEIDGRWVRVLRAVKDLSSRLTGRLTTIEHEIHRLERGAGAAAEDGGGLVDAYLDLVEASLTGELQRDPAMNTTSAGAYDPELRAYGRDWPSSALTMIGRARMRNIRALAEQVFEEGVEGDFLEAGVWRGGACIYMRAIQGAYGETSRRVWVADSFAGLPKPDAEAYPADANDPHHTFTELAVPIDEVRDNFRRYGLLDDEVRFLKGWFWETLPAAPIEKLAMLRLDGDMYASTIQTLEALYDKVSPGGFVIIDDYILPACRRAVDDFRAARGIEAPMTDVDGAAVFWRVDAAPVRRSNLVFWQQMQEQDYFEKHPCYDGLTDNRPIELDLIEGYRPLTPDMKVVVIGCGYGRESVHIAPRVGHVWGIDVSGRILDKAVRYLQSGGVTNFTPVLAEAYADDVPQDIDLVFSIVVMQHLTRDLVRDYFATLAPRLAPDGAMLVQFLEHPDPGRDADAAMKVYEPSVSWPAERIEALARDVGLSVEIRSHEAEPGALWHWAWFRRAGPVAA